MPHPLEDKLARLRRRVRLLAMIYGACATASAAVAAAIILGLADYVLRFQDRGVRIIAMLALFGALCWAFHRYFYRAASARFCNELLAIKLQRRFPALRDRLLTAVEFIAQDEDDPTGGSPVLRRSVIAQTAAETEDIDFNSVIDLRPAVRAALLSAAVCAAAAILVIADPPAARIALSRLINPLNNAAWPQQNHLVIRRPVERVARHQVFEIEAVDARGARLPGEVFIHYRFSGSDGAIEEETALMPQAGNAALARRENVTRPFSYRVAGGDDNSMPWSPVEVVDRPAVKSLSITLFPPAYAGRPPEKAERNICALAGTRLKIEAAATKPLQSAAFCLEGGREFTGRIDPDGLSVVFDDPALVVDKSGSYWFRLADREGMLGGEDDRWEITAVADAPPTVIIEQPVGNLFVTPQAVVPLRVAAKDDLAIRGIALAFQQNLSGRSGNSVPDTKETILPLYSGPKQPPAQTSGGYGQSTPQAEQKLIDYLWQLEPLRLAPGMQVTFDALASDYLPQETRSQPRRLLVVTPAELEARIAGRQNLLLSELDRVLKMQRSALEQVEAAESRLHESKSLQQADLDQLRAAELVQRQVGDALTSRGEGVPSHVFAMLADMENNRIDNPDLSERLKSALEEIERIKREDLPVIGREMTSAVKSAEIALSDPALAADSGAKLSAALASAGKNQAHVGAALEKVLSQFSQWQGNSRFQRELTQLLRQQEATAARTTETGRRTLGKELGALAPQDSADLRALGSRQSEHARTFERIFQDIERAVPELEKSDPLGAKILAVALDEAGRMGIGGQMLSCADSLRQNQIGQAAELQTQIIDDLRQVVDMLIHQSTRQSLADQLARLQNLIKRLRDRQQNVADETARMDQARPAQGQFTRVQAAAVIELARSQRSLQLDTSDLAGQISSAAFALALESAARDMSDAAGLLDERLTGPQTRQAQESAITRLDLLADALKPEPPENRPKPPDNAGKKPPATGQQPANKPPSPIALSELKLLRMLQEEINRRTAALAEAVGANGQPNDQQRAEYEKLAEEQARLAELVLKMTRPEQ